MSNVAGAVRGHLQGLRPDLAEGGQLERLPLRSLITSIDMIEFLYFLEERFDLRIADDEVTPEHFGDAASVIRFIEQKLEAGRQA